MAERLTLKWGRVKGWDDLSERGLAIMKRYVDLGVSMSAMAQRDTPEQKQLICELIDSVDGEIWNDWDGVAMTKDAAKAYVMNYGERPKVSTHS